jgi:putative Mg2+ transporter-C (MgtC) family protein
MHSMLAIVWFWNSSDRTLAHLLLAVTLGILIGAEREWRQRSAGLRTNTLVCLGAAAFVDLAATLTHTPTSISLMVQYVVSGVGFLGAGAIMKEGASIRGLNTAATLWCSAAVGATAAGGKAVTALTLCLIVIAVNLLLRPVTIYIDRISGNNLVIAQVAYVIRIACAEASEAHMRALLLQGLSEVGLALQELESSNTEQPGVVAIIAHVLATVRNDQALERLSGRLSLEPSVSGVRWQVAPPVET